MSSGSLDQQVVLPQRICIMRNGSARGYYGVHGDPALTGAKMSRYMKAIAAFLGALATWGIAAGADGGYDQVELWGLAGVLATVLATYSIPNTPPAGEPADPRVSEKGPY